MKNVNVKEEKVLIRKRCSEIRNGISKQEKARRDEKICALCASLAVFRFAEAVLLYYPIRSEVDVRALIRLSLSLGKQVYLPRCDKTESGKMEFYRIASEEELVTGMFGVSEPAEGAPLWENDEGIRAICIIPALAYDKSGYRLGYGKGYYDRFFSRFKGTGIGVTYSELILSDLPHNRFDLKANLIVSEKGISVIHEV